VSFSNALTGVALQADITGTVGITGNVPVLNAPGTGLVSTTTVDDLGLQAFAVATLGVDVANPTPLAAPRIYQTIAVELVANLATSAGVCVHVVNTTSAFSSGAQYQRLEAASISGRLPGPLFFPVAANVGDVLKVYVTQTWGTVQTISAVIFGLGAYVAPTPLRSDGRSQPQNTLNAYIANAAAGTLTLIAAPVAGCRILLGSILMASATATSIASIEISIGGGVQNLMVTRNAGTIQSPEWGNGILLDPATGVECFATGTTTDITAQFDVVI